MKHIVIVGNGITGTTVARHVRKYSDYKVTIISSETKYFFSRTALMYIYMGHMTFEQTKPYEDWFWEKNKINLVFDHVEKILTKEKNIQLREKGEVDYDELVLTTGSTPNKFGWPGKDLKGVQGLFSYQDLESMEKNTKGISHAVIVGGGLIGVEMAEMLLSRGIAVTFLVREKAFWHSVLPLEEAEMIGRHIKKHHVDLRLGEELVEIKDDGTGRVQSVVTKAGEEIACGFVGLTVGVHPNIDLLEGTPIEKDKGILVNEYLETNVPHIHAAGDCAQFREPYPERRSVEQVWYTGKIQGETLAKTLTGARSIYQPGIWFNSAKFFDIEYQTYGYVSPKPGEGIDAFYWEDAQREKCLRIHFDTDSKAVTGFNFFGIRARHAVCETWIAQKTPVQEVMAHLKAANFDPEFFRSYEEAILTSFRDQFKALAPDRLASNKGIFEKYVRRLIGKA